jgi:hypothetical protein
MKILTAIKSGVFSSLKSWKGVLIIWLSSLLLVGLVAIPMKGALNSDLGKSMITEKLADGFNIEVFSDLGPALKSLVTYISRGLLMIIFVGFLLNIFLTGGLFNSIKKSAVDFSAGEFFRASAKNFWSFLVILLLITVIELILFVIIVIVPLVIVNQDSVPAEGAMMNTVSVVLPLFFLIMAILLLVADYARAWQVSDQRNACFAALGFGFSQTFRTFLSSYPLMIILLIVQLIFGYTVVQIISGMKPVTGSDVILLFLYSQLLVILKIMLKAWRYGSVTAMMDLNKEVSQDQMGSEPSHSYDQAGY